MMKYWIIPSVVLLVNTSTSLAFAPFRTTPMRTASTDFGSMESHMQVSSDDEASLSRQDFFQQSAFAAMVVGFSTLGLSVEPAFARGRATLDQAYEKYTPRIIKGGEFYKSDLRTLISRGDFSGVKAALAEPPKKSKADRAKADGGTSERAAQAGGFSDARVLVAADLFASTFSDNSVSTKTKKMKEEVDKLRSVVEQMESLARQGLGEETGGGGLFGFGAKKLSKDEITKKLKELYIDGGNAYNQYVFAANDGLPVQFQKLPYL